MDQGLPAALSAAAKRSVLPTRVETLSLRRYPAEVEATVYFCCLEALQNANKHAGPGATLTIRVAEDTARLVFEVIDDGVGFESREKGLGVGFVNMNDRLGAVGGSLQVDSTPGRGTRVKGSLPLTEVAERSGDTTRSSRASVIPHPPLRGEPQTSELSPL
jgi:signal transduction histidine kinase